MKDSREISACAPEMQRLGTLLIEKFWKRFAPFFIMPVFTQRTPLTHEALWAQGRTDLQTVNLMRLRAGLVPITDADNNKVTWTKNSRHLLVPSEAIDFAVALDPDGPSGPKKPVIEWDDMPRYRAMGVMAEELGLVWGGESDGGHVELARRVNIERA
jgi:hypothetical protein